MKTQRWPVDPGAPRLARDFAQPICVMSAREADLQTVVRLQVQTITLLRAALDSGSYTISELRRQLQRWTRRSSN